MDLETINALTPREAALVYTQWDLPVILVHGITPAGLCTCKNAECNSPGKHPIQKNWTNSFPNTANEVDNMFDEWPDANVGLLTGPESCLLVLDIDSKEDQSASDILTALELKLGNLPVTPKCLTGGGGFHLFFQYPSGQDVGNSVGKLAKQVDIRGKGGFVVAAPSRHISGGIYKWIS